METAARFIYYAYISYAPEDEKRAKWLQQKLSHYTIPTAIRKSSPGRMPKKVSPIYRKPPAAMADSEARQPRQELSDSRYLIVICSLDSARSEVVDREIRQFKEMGREDRIIPFIVAGEPDGPNGEECFPPSLRGTGLLGASLNELSEEEALIKIVAGLLGLKFDMLWDREKREQKKQRWRRVMVGGVLVAFFCLGGSFYWDYNFHEKTAYFSNVVEIYGVARGIDLLSEDQAENRDWRYKLTELKGRVIAVEQVDREGRLIGQDQVASESGFYPLPGLPAKIEYTYDEQGDLDKATCFSDDGRQAMTLDYTSPETATIYSGDQLIAGKQAENSTVLDAANNANGSESEMISQYVFYYDEEGKTIKKLFCNIYHSPKPNENGSYGEAYRYDEYERLYEITYLNADGAAAADKNGRCQTILTRNTAGDIIKISDIGFNGETI